MASYTETPVGGLQISGGRVEGTPAQTDTFTGTNGTNLSSHTSDSGGTWTKHSSYSGNSNIQSNRLQGATTNNALYYYSVVPSGADYTIDFTWYDLGYIQQKIGVAARVSTVANTAYLGYYDGGDTTFKIDKVVAGVTTNLGSWINSPSNGAVAQFRVIGSSLSMYVNGTLRVGPITDTAITAQGRAGVWSNRSGGMAIDDWTMAADPVPLCQYYPGQSGGIQVGAKADPTGNAYVVAAAGGVQACGGADPTAVIYSQAAGGGIQVGGERVYLWTTSPAPSGGIEVSGYSPVIGLAYSETPRGGIQAGGSPEPSVGKTAAPSGGLQLWGYSDPTAAWYAIAPVGGLQLGGSLSTANAYGYSPSGGLQLGAYVIPVFDGSIIVSGGIQVGPIAVLADLQYIVYANDGQDSKIDYDTPVYSTGLLTWTSGPLTGPAQWRWGVRAKREGLEEENLDAHVRLLLDAAGADVTAIPLAPSALTAWPTANGSAKVSWRYPTISLSNVTGFRVYKGTGGVVDYGTVVATVPATSSVGGSFSATISGLSDGVEYTVGVRAYNATDEERNAATVAVTADATGPAAVSSLSIEATSERGGET